MEKCEKGMTIAFYVFFVCSAVIEIIFLFYIPYYYYSIPLQCLKIIRILLGIINLLIELYFEIVKYAEYLIKKEEQRDAASVIKRYQLTDIILIIAAFIISAFTVAYNIAGIFMNTKYLKKTDTSYLQQSIFIDSLCFLIENILILLCWFFFFIFWIIKFKGFIEAKKAFINNKENINIDGAPPIGSLQQQPSSERELNKNNKK